MPYSTQHLPLYIGERSGTSYAYYPLEGVSVTSFNITSNAPQTRSCSADEWGMIATEQDASTLDEHALASRRFQCRAEGMLHDGYADALLLRYAHTGILCPMRVMVHPSEMLQSNMVLLRYQCRYDQNNLAVYVFDFENASTVERVAI